MKKQLFLISIMLMLTLNLFSQKTMSSDNLVRKYVFYKENPTPFQKKTLSFDEWKVKHNYIEESNDLQTQYFSYYNKTIGAISFEEWKLKNENSIITSGDYFIKGSNQILSGIGLQIFATGFVLVMSDVYSNKLENINSNHTEEINLIINQQKACNIGACVVGLIGLGFEISGFLNYKKAGINLNANGIGIKVKF